MAAEGGRPGLSAAGKPATIAALAHVGPLGAVGEHFVKLRVPQPIAPAAGHALVFDKRRLVRLGLCGLDDQPVFAGAAGPVAGMGMAAAAGWQESSGNLPGGWEGRGRIVHKQPVFSGSAITVRWQAGISSPISGSRRQRRPRVLGDGQQRRVGVLAFSGDRVELLPALLRPANRPNAKAPDGFLRH